MRKKLAGLLAGECTPSEELALRRHLGDCPVCAGELEGLESVCLLLNLLEPENPPAGLVGSIMESIENTAENKNKQSVAVQQKPAHRPARLFRDLAVAAAAALAVFWLGGSLFGPVTSSAEGKLSGAVTGYVRYTGVAVSRTNQAVAELNSELFSTAGRFSPIKNETGK